MGNVLKMTAPRTIDFETYEEKVLSPGEVRLQMLYSGISAGTQLTLYRGTNPFVSKKWNNDLKIFEGPQEGGLYPAYGGWGYEEVGRVVETGSTVKSVKIGDLVFGAWGHRSSQVVEESFAQSHRMPEGLEPVSGIFAQMGAIALNAILDADIHVGETVAVFGQGVPGQIVSQLAKLNGATVVAVDLDDRRLAYSKKFGADVVLNPKNCDAAMEIRKLTENRGADVCIEISGFTPALHEAVRATCYSGRVVCSGFFQGNANGLFLGEEFHHNRINIVGSQIFGVNPSLTYRWNKLRMEQTIMELQKGGKIDLRGLISHIVPFREAPKAYDMLDKGTEECLQVVLEF
jgi:2-desacetyl-2-hydroxyethyl bacteriochlorophyllide A dehydrogenase